MAIASKKVCKYCGMETNMTTEKCPNCNAVMFVDKPAPPPEPLAHHVPVGGGYSPNPNPYKKTIIIAAALVGIVALVIIVVSLLGSSGLTPEKFIEIAESKGYYNYIDEDYDGYNTYWVGAYKLKPGVTKPDGSDDLELEAAAYYWIDYTRDTSKNNAIVEYNRYVNGGYVDYNGDVSVGVKNIGTTINQGSGDDYQFIINQSSTQYAIAYRVGRVNILAITPIEYKDEVHAFFVALDLKF